MALLLEKLQLNSCMQLYPSAVYSKTNAPRFIFIYFFGRYHRPAVITVGASKYLFFENSHIPYLLRSKKLQHYNGTANSTCSISASAPKIGLPSFPEPVPFPLYPIVRETNCCISSGLVRSPKTDSAVGLTQLSNIWRTNRRSSILRMCPSQFHHRSLARNRTSTGAVLTSSTISLSVTFNSILEHIAFNFLRTFSFNFHDSQPYRIVETTAEPKRRRHRLIGSFASVGNLQIPKAGPSICDAMVHRKQGFPSPDCMTPGYLKCQCLRQVLFNVPMLH